MSGVKQEHTEQPLGVNAWHDRGRRTGAGNWLITASLVMFFVITLGAVAIRVLTGYWVSSTVVTTLWVINAFVGFVGVGILGSGVLSLRKRLRANGYRLCLHCHYPLPSEPPSGICPECGLKYDLPATVDAWHKGGPARRLKAGESR